METHLFHSLLRVGRLAAVLATLAVTGRAERWVDAVHGSNANSGDSPATAWRTITYAVATAGGDWIHVAPGLYDAALGESFPLTLPAGTAISGTQGSAVTLLDGCGASVLLDFNDASTTPIGPETGADGLTLRQGGTGIRMYARGAFAPDFWDIRIEGVGTGIHVSGGGGQYTPTLADVRVQNATGAGVVVNSYAAGPTPGEGLEPAFVRLEVLNCGTGVEVGVYGSSSSLFGASGGIVLTDSVIRGSTNDGIRYWASGACGPHGCSTGSAYVHLNRCRVLDNGGNGAYGSPLSGSISLVVLTAEASLFAGNLGCGLLGDGAESDVTLEDCTVADNVICGARGAGGQATSLRNCILARNTDDLDLATTPAASYTDCANGDLAGFPDCIAADPLFVDPPARDYGLRFGSPCVDTGDPASAGSLDLVRNTRTYDGNLDNVVAPDRGALEYALVPLVLTGTPHLGAVLGLEITGPAGSPTIVYSSRRPLAATPTATPFGGLWLERPSITTYAHTHSDPGPPSVVRVTLTTDPTWVGRTVSFQARIGSAAAPAGAVLSNPVQFTIVP